MIAMCMRPYPTVILICPRTYILDSLERRGKIFPSLSPGKTACYDPEKILCERGGVLEDGVREYNRQTASRYRLSVLATPCRDRRMHDPTPPRRQRLPGNTNRMQQYARLLGVLRHRPPESSCSDSACHCSSVEISKTLALRSQALGALLHQTRL
jgi:hypothetical protein